MKANGFPGFWAGLRVGAVATFLLCGLGRHVQAQGVVRYGPFEGSMSFVIEQVGENGKAGVGKETFVFQGGGVSLFCSAELTQPVGVKELDLTLYDEQNQEVEVRQVKVNPDATNLMVPFRIPRPGKYKVSLTTPFNEEDGGYSVVQTIWFDVR